MARRDRRGEALEIGGRAVEVTSDDHQPHVDSQGSPVPLQTDPRDEQGIDVDAPTVEMVRDREFECGISQPRADSDKPRSFLGDESVATIGSVHRLQGGEPGSAVHHGRYRRCERPFDRLGDVRRRLVLELRSILFRRAELSVQGTHRASR